MSSTTLWRRANPDAARRHREQEKQRWRDDPNTRERHKAANRRNRQQLKIDAYNAYGGFICSCCGETCEPFLSLDHVNGDGARHRKTFTSGGAALYRWLKKHGYPEGFRVLCMNCNYGRQMNGGVCPHQED